MTPKMAVKMINGSIAMLLDSADIPTERDFHDKTLNHKTRMGATTTRSRDENAAQPRANFASTLSPKLRLHASHRAVKSFTISLKIIIENVVIRVDFSAESLPRPRLNLRETFFHRFIRNKVTTAGIFLKVLPPT